MADYDVLFAGGGLASTLAACRMKMLRPELAIAVIEASGRLGGNHTWSFHDTDLTAEQSNWLEPFISYRWAGQKVRFPQFERDLNTAYLSITSERLHEVAIQRLGDGVWLNTVVAGLEAGSVTLADGEKITADCVIDGRGVEPISALKLGFQKFVGLELRLLRPHGETVPTIMDATLRQDDGYRFIYTLPFSADRILVEDTYYADGPELEPEAIRAKILAYASGRGWDVAEILREETGTLPIVLGGDIDAFWNEVPGEAARIGLRACLFHPTTGYSLPDAVAMADALAVMPEVTTFSARQLAQSVSKRLWQERSFFRMLNRFLFLAAEPAQRFRIMQRFYRLRQSLIERFYSARSTAMDKARIMFGRPPVSILKVAANIRERSVFKEKQDVRVISDIR